MASSGFLRAIASHIQQSSRKAAIESAGNKIAQIVGANDGGGYDLRLADGMVISNINNQTRTKWTLNQWVTISRANGVWCIVGVAAAHA